LQHLQRFIQCIKYIILELSPPLLSPIPLPWFLEQFQRV
jgi:hypothetical protein